MSYNYTQQHPGHSFLVVPVKNQYGIMHASREICTGHTGFLMLLFLSSTSSSFGWGPETEFSASVSPFRSGLTWVVHQVRTRLPLLLRLPVPTNPPTGSLSVPHQWSFGQTDSWTGSFVFFQANSSVRCGLHVIFPTSLVLPVSLSAAFGPLWTRRALSHGLQRISWDTGTWGPAFEA